MAINLGKTAILSTNRDIKNDNYWLPKVIDKHREGLFISKWKENASRFRLPKCRSLT
jgi:hypothetical protein